MSILIGNYTMQVVTNPSVHSALELTFKEDHVVVCEQLASVGRYNVEDGYLLMSFADGDNFSAETEFACFARIVPGTHNFEGVMLDCTSGQRHGCEGRPGGLFPPNTTFRPFNPLPMWPPNEFPCEESPDSVKTILRFEYSSSQIGSAELIFVGRENPAFKAPMTNLAYPESNEELVVFATKGLLAYGAVVDRSNQSPVFKKGRYMNPFNGEGSYGTWHSV